jgi:hypothetical protein
MADPSGGAALIIGAGEATGRAGARDGRLRP